MRRNFLVIAFLFFAGPALVHAQTPDTLSLKDIWYSGKYVEKSSADYHALKDGLHYTQLIDVPNGQAIVEFDFATGRATDTLMNAKSLIPRDSSKALRIADYVLNDDESEILIYAGRQQIYRRSFLASYFVFNLKTKTLQPVSTGKQQSCVLSPDGSMAAFVRDNNLFIKSFQSNQEFPITTDGIKNHVINGVSDWVYEEEFEFTTAFQWSPDGKHLAYYRFDESDVPEYTLQYFKDLYPQNYTYKYPKVGEKNSVVSVHIYDVDTKQTATVDVGPETDQYIPRIKWTQDQNVLCVFRMNRLQNKLELLLANANTGSTQIMFTETNSKYIEINDALTFFNHNKNFIWMSEQNGWQHLYNYTTSGKLINEITKGNYDVMELYGIDEKNATVYYQSAEISPLERYVYSIKLDGSNKKQISKQQGTNDAVFNPAFSYYMISHSDANTPPDFILYENKSGKQLRVLEDNHELTSTLKAMNLPKKEFFQFKISENVLLNGYMIKPANFDSTKKYPVFMTFYGGPASQQVLNSWGGTFQLYFDYLTAKGYIIACVDNRGTGARGEAFRKITYLQLGHYECIDQIEAAKYLSTLDYVDASRIGTYGWSYGGFLSTLCIEKGNDVFKAAVAVAPVTNWKYYDDIYTERYMQTDQENRNGYEDNSPVNFASRIKGHFLVIHGLDDDNVHYQNTAMLLKQLYAANVHFDQMVFPDKNHSISGGTTRYYLFGNVTDWILKNL